MTGMMKSMISMDYDRGLKMLKEWIETDSISSTVEINGRESIPPTRIVGARRTCTLQDGAVLKERLVELSDEGRCLVYEITDSPLPIQATICTAINSPSQRCSFLNNDLIGAS